VPNEFWLFEEVDETEEEELSSESRLL